ncbi:MAG: MobF family relaxase [Prochloraceae cyanobacterium]|nr:MobF family relaxase [Prochloraceae cyanobacterium]
MLSITTISPKQGEKYYRQENYYTNEEAKQHSQWWGKGAENLGLSGAIDSKDFKNLLYGKSPDGEINLSGRKVDPDKHRAGVDCTFSATKSVSIKALVDGERALIEAHKKAVEQTLKVIQERYAQTRVSTPEGRQVINTDNLIVGQFHHDTSRAKDPQLHTHCVILNATQLQNRQWRSHHNEEIYRNKMLLGQIYRNNLAREIEKLGYEIERKENGLFEIKGYTVEQLETFSKRSLEIKAAAGENASSKEKEYAALVTRIAKDKEINRDDLKEYWQKEAEQVNVNHPQPLTQTKNQPAKVASLDVAVSDAIAHCSERNVNFKRADLEKFVLSSAGKYDWDELQKELDKKENSLLKAKGKENTTTIALFREIDTIRLVQDNKNSVAPIAARDKILADLEDTSLTSGQRDALVTAATTGDRFIGWQGKAGAGKTYALNQFREIAQNEGYVIKGYAPSAEAAKVLGEEIGVESNTVARLLHSKQKQVDSKEEEQAQLKEIWIVDEAGLLNARDAYSLLFRASEEKARVILVGDTRQLSGVEAGNPFKSIQKAGMTTAYLNQSLRQKTEDLQQAVESISEGRVTEGLKMLDENKRISEIEELDSRITKLTSDYLDLSLEERKNTLILAGTNEEREAIVNKIRTSLKEEGSLGKETLLERLKSKDLTLVQMKYAHNYQKGDIIMPLRDYKRLELKKGSLYPVTNTADDSLTLKLPGGRTKQVAPAKFKHKAVFERDQIEMAVGDRLRWLKNDKKLARRNGQQFEVTDITGNTASIKYDNNDIEQIELNKPQHLDYALVSTTYSSQGKTAKRVLVSASSDCTLNKESFYVAASRAKYNLQIYAEDKSKLFEKAVESRAKKNPLEILSDIDKQHAATKDKLLLALASIATSDPINQTAEVRAEKSQSQSAGERDKKTTRSSVKDEQAKQQEAQQQKQVSTCQQNQQQIRRRRR